MNDCVYNEAYYEHGVETNMSCYVRYRWLPELTIPMCKAMSDYLSMSPEETILDYGCAKGYIVRAFCELGYNARGVDISPYAVEHCDETVKDRIDLIKTPSDVLTLDKKYNWCVSKDVFEHVAYEQIDEVLQALSKICRNIFIIVPTGDGEKYIIPEYEHDVTHIIRESMFWWMQKLEENNFEVTDATYRIEGIKDNWIHYPTGNVMITARTISVF